MKTLDWVGRGKYMRYDPGYHNPQLLPDRHQPPPNRIVAPQRELNLRVRAQYYYDHVQKIKGLPNHKNLFDKMNLQPFNAVYGNRAMVDKYEEEKGAGLRDAEYFQSVKGVLAGNKRFTKYDASKSRREMNRVPENVAGAEAVPVGGPRVDDGAGAAAGFVAGDDGMEGGGGGEMDLDGEEDDGTEVGSDDAGSEYSYDEEIEYVPPEAAGGGRVMGTDQEPRVGNFSAVIGNQVNQVTLDQVELGGAAEEGIPLGTREDFNRVPEDVDADIRARNPETIVEANELFTGPISMEYMGYFPEDKRMIVDGNLYVEREYMEKLTGLTKSSIQTAFADEVENERTTYALSKVGDTLKRAPDELTGDRQKEYIKMLQQKRILKIQKAREGGQKILFRVGSVYADEEPSEKISKRLEKYRNLKRVSGKKEKEAVYTGSMNEQRTVMRSRKGKVGQYRLFYESYGDAGVSAIRAKKRKIGESTKQKARFDKVRLSTPTGSGSGSASASASGSQKMTPSERLRARLLDETQDEEEPNEEATNAPRRARVTARRRPASDAADATASINANFV